MAPVRREHLLPFLCVAYPTTFALLETRPYCRPGCGPFGAADLVALAAVVVGSSLASVLVVRTTLGRGIGHAGRADGPVTARVRAPSGPTVALLVVTYLAFAGFVVLDAANVAEALWKPVVLPGSLLPFAPVWLLYAGTFVLAAVLGAVGATGSPTLTVAVRVAVVVVGFAGSAIWQFALVEALVGRRG